MDTYIIQIFNGISVSSIFILAALGLGITFGLMKVINMAHGEFIMIGAYVTFLLHNLFAAQLPAFFDTYFFFAIPAAFIVAGMMGLILEQTVIKHLYGRPLDSMLATWGVSLILQQLARSIFGAPNVDVRSPAWLNGGLIIQGLQFPYKRLFIIGLVIVCLAGIFWLLFKTTTGRRIRAVMQNRDMAAGLGINARKIDAYTFAIGSGFAGVAGCALSLIGSIGPTLGTAYIVDTFMVVVLGGVGTLWGIVAGGLVIGTANTTFEFFTNTSWGKVLVFLLVILFLQWKPKGLFTIHSRSLDEQG
ncbi:urea ABC transporter permease subunit UrtB [Sporomusa acidovorans]|uniref:High-affinity branched-chain amino acid transport system permease protein LivH n=1 Tax=Sporomusa acidovorans (strain ATCC 49682 / DSM 3132 / Mol) TaxID=1123286 RepID=A0ABZ3J9W0_SPOA4|nr:urea ABC transporter permease subunit UrtB [Sporomusa acidovorans]OZC16238.1 high-affinity branched-chain amino acid transport system permease protein LivH [Sporomusa acidovorans DSM 3132]SDE32349.1 urea ABC transporter membrane protein [Sporomusa acidovorans]